MTASPPLPLARRWVLVPSPPARVMEALAAYPPIAQRLLANRGVSSAAQAELYLAPDRRLLPPPALLPDMDRAIARLYRALLSGERIAIYGDFDADGVTATALLVEALRALGADPLAYIPHRVDEGHGLNRAALAQLAAAGCTLVVTADCGITGLPGGETPPPGLDLIITDHHLPGLRLPTAVAAVDPQRPDASGYPWPELAGVGVAFKLAQGLYESLGRSSDETMLELVALGTVADVAPLVGENRYLVRTGLQRLRTTRRPGLRALARRAGYDLATLDEEAIGYGLGPRLNAAGRMAHADLSLRLLLATDEAEAEALAGELSRLNELRQRATQEVVQRARQAILAADTLEPLLMVGAPDFPPGIVGLAAGRLAEEFYRPALVFQQGPAQIRGSARSIPEFDVTAALARCAGLLTRFGGHRKAAGFSAPATHLEPLRTRLLALAGELLDGVELAPTLTLDAEVAPSALPGALVPALLQHMAPFGEGNRVPAFLARGLEVLDARPVGDGSHLRLKLREIPTLRSGEGRATWDAIAFGLGGRSGEAHGRLDIAFSLRAANDHPAGRGALELEVLDFRRAQP